MMHRMQLSAAVLVLGATLSIAACAKGDRDGTDTAAAAGAVTTDTAHRDTMAGATASPWNFDADHPKDDRERMMVVTQSNAVEIASSTLATTQATNAAVKTFANDMIRDHNAMLKDGEPLAQQLGVVRNPGDSTVVVGDDARRKLDDLRSKSGKDFDKEYMEMQVDAHQKTLDRLKDMQDDAQNAQLKTMITSAIPKVQAHLDRAKKLKDQVD